MNTCYTYIYFLRIFQFKKKKKKNETRHTILIVINFLEKRLIDQQGLQRAPLTLQKNATSDSSTRSSWPATISETYNFLSGWNTLFDDESLVVVVERWVTRESCCTGQRGKRDIFFPCHLFDKTRWLDENMSLLFLGKLNGLVNFLLHGGGWMDGWGG